MLADVVDAAKAVYKNCLIEKGQVGLEFPGEGHIFAQVMRLDGVPVGGLGVGGGGMGEGEGRRVVLPEGKGVLYISDSDPGQRLNDSRAS